MDRSSFIRENHPEHLGKNQCGEKDCVCVETNTRQQQIMKKASSLHLVTMSVLALLCAFVFSEYKSHASIIKTDKWLFEKKVFLISCGKLLNQDKGAKNDQQPGRNSENNCSHQAAVISKRRYLNFFHC
jgi:hypothetical protein